MIRQRVHLRRLGLSELVLRLLVSVLAAALVLYGVMVVLAALKLDPRTINQLSAYHTVYRDLTTITAAQITGRDRIIAAVAGLLCLLVFGPLAWRVLPRPYLARTTVDAIPDSEAGQTDVSPRAIERIAEVAAAADGNVDGASARYGAGSLDVRVQLSSAESLLGELTAIQQRVRESLRAHGLPDDTTIDVTFGGAA